MSTGDDPTQPGRCLAQNGCGLTGSEVERLAHLAMASESLESIGGDLGRLGQLLGWLTEPHTDLADVACPLRGQIGLLQQTFEMLAREVMRFSILCEDNTGASDESAATSIRS